MFGPENVDSEEQIWHKITKKICGPLQKYQYQLHGPEKKYYSS
jgi:hypothetical protein